ncbi:MAG TPA: DUF72 domain-containing protein [Candidatus Acidoferrum sp.]|jgi:uncharacterized protein YecE (DUF72 family)|nr:DUF72 domain-containing protein [Candidatus Acidoferrum sp.]
MGTIYAGSSGWAYAGWKPDFYPAKLAAAKFLGYYSTRLNSVELNYTFRRTVTKKLLAGWSAATPAEFRFAVKASQSITHIKRLRGVGAATSKFIASLEPLRLAGKLGPVLFQLPPNLKCDLALLDEFLADLPRDTHVAMEFRHASWFTDDVYDRLGRANVALCEAESDKLKTPEIATANFRYMRLRMVGYSAGARKAISKRVTDAAHNGDVFVYFKHEDTPHGALYAENLLKSAK